MAHPDVVGSDPRSPYPSPSPAGRPAAVQRSGALYIVGSDAREANRLAAPQRNRLLEALAPSEYAELLPELEPVSVDAGEMLLRIGTPVEHVYFPEGAVAAIGLNDRDDVAAVGRDGLLGLAVLLGGDRAHVQATVRVPGRALRMSAPAIRRAVDALPSLRRLLDFYTHALVLQIAHAGSCGRAHALEPRLAALLLWMRDQAGSDHLPLTHEHLARLLGTARRPSVTEATLALRSRGVLRTHRGGLTITDPAALTARSCGCYAVVREHFDRLGRGDGLRR